MLLPTTKKQLKRRQQCNCLSCLQRPLQVQLEAVWPDLAGRARAEEEYRLSVALLPLRLRVRQSMVVFLQDFFTPAAPPRGVGQASAGVCVVFCMQHV